MVTAKSQRHGTHLCRDILQAMEKLLEKRKQSQLNSERTQNLRFSEEGAVQPEIFGVR